ncbi:MAG TPA: hypothetical protein VLG09_02185 [Candidatus Saccharimonadales bacterium]|jgi:hypothetical protein|nr:hypothetical protein [Candidatus Saccharimonadales bacterium]
MPDDDMPLHGYKEDFDSRFDDFDGLIGDEDADEEDQIREDEIRIA